MNNEALLVIFGAALAILGGAVGDEFRAWREGRRELRAIKVAISDELAEIVATIANMHEVWDKTKVLSPVYISALRSNTTIFDGLRTRLFLIRNQGLRKDISAFYKKLKDTAEKSEGSLAESNEAIEEQRAYEASFQALADEAKKIQTRLEAKWYERK